jgi:hypothetical protein
MRFLIPYITGKKIIWSYLYFLQILNAYAQKNEYFRKFSKKIFFANIYQSESHQVLKIKGP